MNAHGLQVLLPKLLDIQTALPRIRPLSDNQSQSPLIPQDSLRDCHLAAKDVKE